jgi:hypothetical protein
MSNNCATTLENNIAFSLDDSMRAGLQLYFELAYKHAFIENVKPLAFTRLEPMRHWHTLTTFDIV